jgi:hypothetical protein
MQLRPQIHFAQREKIIPIIISVHLRSREAKPKGRKGKAKGGSRKRVRFDTAFICKCSYGLKFISRSEKKSYPSSPSAFICVHLRSRC